MRLHALRVGAPMMVGALLALTPAGAEDPPSPRADLERFESELDRAVRKVSRPSGGPLLAGAEGCRGYHLSGYGALFVLTPRALPVRPRAAHESTPQPGPATSAALRARLERTARSKTASAADREAAEDLLALEAHAMALQRAAETTREEAEAALEETTRELHRRLVSSTLGTPESPAPIAPAVPAPPAVPPVPAVAAELPPPPIPPWKSWYEQSEEPEEPRAPERVVDDVRGAVTGVMEMQGPPLHLAPEEFVVVVVDFLPRSAFATRTRPARTLVVRVRKRELDARAAGQLASEELRKRIEYSEY